MQMCREGLSKQLYCMCLTPTNKKTNKKKGGELKESQEKQMETTVKIKKMSYPTVLYILNKYISFLAVKK